MIPKIVGTFDFAVAILLVGSVSFFFLSAAWVPGVVDSNLDKIQASAQEKGTLFDREKARDALRQQLFFNFLAGILVGGLLLAAGMGMARGRPWSRYILLVLFALWGFAFWFGIRRIEGGPDLEEVAPLLILAVLITLNAVAFPFVKQVPKVPPPA